MARATLGILFCVLLFCQNTFSEDTACTQLNGVCQSASLTCSGRLQYGKCTGSQYSWCCLPPVIKSSYCYGIKGQCQNMTLACSGKYLPGLCDGKVDIGCCLPPVGEMCKKKGGVCQKATGNCTGPRIYNLCAGNGEENWCCLPPTVSEKVCKRRGGECQNKTEGCSGRYLPGTCNNLDDISCCLSAESISDALCDKAGGKCTNTTQQCTGQRRTGMCRADKANPWCCLPDSITEEQCKKRRGVCQNNTLPCDGAYTDQICNNQNGIGCCLSKEAVSDVLCEDGGGVCQAGSVKCEGRFKFRMCNANQMKPLCCLPPSMPERFCTHGEGSCQNSSMPCSGKYLDFVCDEKKDIKCCLPLELTNDARCTKQEGVCQKPKEACAGQTSMGQCKSDPAKSWCCLPIMVSEKLCSYRAGTCQNVSMDCSGEYMEGRCKGKPGQGCCLALESITDQKCTKTGGKCVGFKDKCSGYKKLGICHASKETPFCCLPKSIKAETCKRKHGVCQNDSIECAGGYLDETCDHQVNVRCCLSADATSDKLCTDAGGTCQSQSEKCSGPRSMGFCNSDTKKTPFCCLPRSISEKECNEKKGKCQKEATVCPGKYLDGFCSGKVGVKCCLGFEAISNILCAAKGGTCVGRSDKCVGSKQMRMCNAADTQDSFCCVPPYIPKQICERNGGSCQDSEMTCGGKYMDGLCDGEPDVGCCLGANTISEAGCTEIHGSCISTSTRCTGSRKSGLCNTDRSKPWCCVPPAIAARYCTFKKGTCQNNNLTCSGKYMDGFCDGKHPIGCCLPKELTTDIRCTSMGGKCQSRQTTCLGMGKLGLCSADTRLDLCCLPRTISENLCQAREGVCQAKEESCPALKGTTADLCEGSSNICCVAPVINRPSPTRAGLVAPTTKEGPSPTRERLENPTQTGPHPTTENPQMKPKDNSSSSENSIVRPEPIPLPKKSVKGTMKLDAVFTEELKNESSPVFQTMKNNTSEWLIDTCQKTYEKAICEVSYLAFLPGSIQINYTMKIEETSVPIPEDDTTMSLQAAMIEESTSFPGGYQVDTATIAVEVDNSKCANVGGTCQPGNSCNGTILKDLCDSATVDICCLPKLKLPAEIPPKKVEMTLSLMNYSFDNFTQCMDGYGTCIDTSEMTCPTQQLKPNLCDSPSDDVQCCIGLELVEEKPEPEPDSAEQLPDNECGRRNGKCSTSNRCGGTVGYGLCGARSNLICCYYPPRTTTAAACTGKGGRCINSLNENCKYGTMLDGLCPESSAEDMCCVPPDYSKMPLLNTPVAGSIILRVKESDVPPSSTMHKMLLNHAHVWLNHTCKSTIKDAACQPSNVSLETSGSTGMRITFIVTIGKVTDDMKFLHYNMIYSAKFHLKAYQPQTDSLKLHIMKLMGVIPKTQCISQKGMCLSRGSVCPTNVRKEGLCNTTKEICCINTATSGSPNNDGYGYPNNQVSPYNPEYGQTTVNQCVKTRGSCKTVNGERQNPCEGKVQYQLCPDRMVEVCCLPQIVHDMGITSLQNNNCILDGGECTADHSPGACDGYLILGKCKSDALLCCSEEMPDQSSGSGFLGEQGHIHEHNNPPFPKNNMET